MSQDISQRISKKINDYEKRCKIWEATKAHINKMKINEFFTCASLTTASLKSICEKRITHNDVNCFIATIELYRYYLVKTGIIKYLDHRTYQKITNIPQNTEVIQLKTIVLETQRDPWKEWFMPLHERLGVTKEELYGGVGEMETQRVVAPL